MVDKNLCLALLWSIMTDSTSRSKEIRKEIKDSLKEKTYLRDLIRWCKHVDMDYEKYLTGVFKNLNARKSRKKV